jgi:hypothetical protein
VGRESLDWKDQRQFRYEQVTIAQGNVALVVGGFKNLLSGLNEGCSGMT